MYNVCPCTKKPEEMFNDLPGKDCSMNSNNNVKFTTVGQKLLKEPIWIGMIVVFILLIIFGICYVIKKKCAKYTVCCKDMKAILREREDEIPAHCNNPISNTPNLSPRVSVEVISESTDLSPSFLNRKKIVVEIAKDSSTATPKPITPTVDMTNREAAAKLFASYDKQLTFPFGAQSPVNKHSMQLHPVGGLKSGVLEFNTQEKEENSFNRFVLRSPPLPSEYRKLKYSQTTSVFDARRDRHIEEASSHIIRSKSLTPGILRETGQSPVILKINDENAKDATGDDEDHSLAVPRENTIRRSSFTEMKAEDKRRLFSKCRSFYPEKSLVPFPNIQRSNSNREVLVVSQSDNCSSDVFNRNSLDVNVPFSTSLTDAYNAPTNTMAFSNSKTFDRTCFLPRNSTASAQIMKNRRGKSTRKRKYYIRIVKNTTPKKHDHSRSRDSSFECSCGSGNALNNIDAGKRKQRKRIRKRVEITDSSSDKEDFYSLQKTNNRNLNFRYQKKRMVDGQTQTYGEQDTAEFSISKTLHSHFSRSSLKNNENVHKVDDINALYYRDKTDNLSSSNQSESDEIIVMDYVRDREKLGVFTTDTDTGFSSSSKSLYAPPWKDDGKVSVYSGNSFTRPKPADAYIPKNSIKSTNSVNSYKVKDSDYETSQSSMDTMSFERSHERSYDKFNKRHEERRITNQLEQVSFKLMMLRNRDYPTKELSVDRTSFAMSDEDLPNIEVDSKNSGRRPSYPGIINKAFTLEHVSEEGDIVYTPEQTSLTEQQGTLDASWAIQPNTTPANNEEIEMVEYLV